MAIALVFFLFLGGQPALADGPRSEECFGTCARQVITAFRLEYVPKRQKTVSWGDTLEFVNGDPDAVLWGGHTVTHFNPYGAPAFDTGVVPFGGRAPVKGVERLLPGKYLVYCRVHPFMRGSFRVIG
jgi:plastocyanin